MIVGGESGPGARPMHPDWVRRVRNDCQDVNVPFFFKQWGEWAPYCDEFKFWLTNKMSEPLTHRFFRHVEPVCGTADPFHRESALMLRVGKARAGYLLDGKEYHEWPA